MAITTDPKKIVAWLEKKKRASTKELDTSVATMKELEAAGIVRQDGTIKSGGRGRPSFAWVLVDGITVDDVDEIQYAEPTSHSNNSSGASNTTVQNKLDKALAEIKEHPRYRGCNCVRKLQAVSAEMLKGYQGCQQNWICNALDDLRRAM